MRHYSLSHLSDGSVSREVAGSFARECPVVAEQLACIAEFDARKLHLPAAYPSMHDYLVGEFRLSEDEAFKRLRAARAAREFPALFPAVADGRLDRTAVVLLAPHLTPANVDELIALATRQTKRELKRLLAERFPRPDLAIHILALPPDATAPSLVPEPVTPAPEARAGVPAERVHVPSSIAPRSAGRYSLQVTVSEETHEKLRYAQVLLGHRVARGDVAHVLDRALDALIVGLERTKFAATARPRRAQRAKAGSRHVPAHVKRAVWERDGGQCTFVSNSGRRCEARGDIEFDHVTEVARGGEATVDGLRLRCRAHNQHTAEQTFGAGFMERKREEARAARAAAKAAAAQARAERDAQAEKSRLLPHELEVIPWLRQLGCREAESRLAASLCRDMAHAPLEDRVKRALSMFGARCGRKVMPVAPAANESSLPAGATA